MENLIMYVWPVFYHDPEVSGSNLSNKVILFPADCNIVGKFNENTKRSDNVP